MDPEPGKNTRSLSSEESLSPQGRKVHRQGPRHVNGGPHPDGPSFQTHETQGNPGDNRGQCFRHRLAEMNHAIRYHHYKYRVDPEAMPGAVKQKTAKEKLQGQELNGGLAFPAPEGGPQGFLGVQAIERASRLNASVCLR